MNEKSPMFDFISGFPGQLEAGYRLGFEAQDLPGGPFDSVAVCGMGGSAIGGDLLLDYARPAMEIPAGVIRGYNLPGWVGENTLALISSYSGNTAETLSCYREAVDRRSLIIGISSGGKLGELCRENGHLLIEIPGGLPPRAALGYSLSPMFALFERLGFINPERDELLTAADFVSRYTKDFSRGSGGAPAELAQALLGKVAAFYADGQRMGAVVTRFRGQLAENSKALSFTHLFPELNHNEIVGWGGPEFTSDNLTAVFLRDSGSDNRVVRQMEAAIEIISGIGVEIREIEAEGDTDLKRILYLVHFADWLSYHLASLYGVDPVPVNRIDILKQRISG